MPKPAILGKRKHLGGLMLITENFTRGDGSTGVSVPVIGLAEYLSGHAKLRIPNWQRDYSWVPTEDGQVGELLQDFRKFV